MNEVKFKANINDVKNAAGLPAPAEADAGKVLTVGEAGGWELGAGGGGGLPAIESGDAGKVLTVNAGETGAEWATPSGGGLPFRVTYTFDENESAYTSDKTLAQIFAAWNAGNFIYAELYGAILMPIKVNVDDEEIDFQMFAYEGKNSTTLIYANINKIVHLMDDNVETITVVYATGSITVAGWSET